MSATMYGSSTGAGAGQAIFTDDVSLQVFMEHLKRLVSGLSFLRLSVLMRVVFVGCWRTNKLELPMCLVLSLVERGLRGFLCFGFRVVQYHVLINSFCLLRTKCYNFSFFLSSCHLLVV